MFFGKVSICVFWRFYFCTCLEYFYCKIYFKGIIIIPFYFSRLFYYFSNIVVKGQIALSLLLLVLLKGKKRYILYIFYIYFIYIILIYFIYIFYIFIFIYIYLYLYTLNRIKITKLKGRLFINVFKFNIIF